MYIYKMISWVSFKVLLVWKSRAKHESPRDMPSANQFVPVIKLYPQCGIFFLLILQTSSWKCIKQWNQIIIIRCQKWIINTYIMRTHTLTNNCRNNDPFDVVDNDDIEMQQKSEYISVNRYWMLPLSFRWQLTITVCRHYYNKKPWKKTVKVHY